MDESNRVVVEAWNTILFDKFQRFRPLVVDALAPFGDAALERCPYRAGQRVLDVGCGFGDSTRQIADRVGPTGEAVGVDCAENFIRTAEAEAREAGARCARFLVADVQQDELQGPYDHAFARFGTMFFALPGAALRNIRRELAPGASFTRVVWRRREENPWVHEAELCVKGIVPVVEHDQTDQVHCGPGPFSMASPDLVSGMLRGAGFERITFERHDREICIGRTLDEAIELATQLGPAGEIMRLAGDEGEKRRPQVMAALRETLGRYLGPEGVRAPASAWFVTATNPR